MDAPAPPESPKPVDEFGLPPPAPRKPVEDDPEPEVPPPPPPAPVMEAENHPEATLAVVTKDGDTLKIVPAAEPPNPVETEAKVEPPKEPEAPIAPVPVPDDHVAAATTTSVEPVAPAVPLPEAPVAIEPVTTNEATVPKAVPVAPLLIVEETKPTSDEKPSESTEHHDTATSEIATPAPSTRTDVTRTDMSSRGRTAASLADLPTPIEIFTGHVAEHPTTLTMKDGQIFDESGEILYTISGRTFTDKQHAAVFNLRRGHFRRRTWKVKPNGGRKQLRIRARQHYGFFAVPMPPESTGGSKNREAVLHANQLRLGATKSVFENKAIVGMVDGDTMQVAKGFDLALAGAMWKASIDTFAKHERRLKAILLEKSKSSLKLKVGSSSASAATV